jgi:hypothetical protein
MRKYSEGFNEIFTFFLRSYRCGILDFCGSVVDVSYNKNSEDGKFSFRMFENGEFKNKTLISRHPNIFKGVIIGKKSWGLWVKEWSDGIVEGSFTKRELLQQFSDNNIKIPEPFLDDFDNVIHKKLMIKIKTFD